MGIIPAPPATAIELTNQGHLLYSQRQYLQSIAIFRQAIAAEPRLVQAHVNLATALLITGQYIEGWQEYEWRSQLPWLKASRLPCSEHTLWQSGINIKNKTLFLLPEQGYGDNIQFVRYAALAAAQGARVILGCPKDLSRLFTPVEGVHRIITDGDTMPLFDYHSYLPSLPALFNTTLETIPANIPYLTADPQLVTAWAKQLSARKKLRVGLTWAGAGEKGPKENLSGPIDKRRSLHLSQLAPLATLENIEFYSLQKGMPAQQVSEMQEKFPLIDYTEKINDFADTAALIENLDLIITVDTAVAHLAGAMGKPTWMLCRFDGCWRWLEGRQDSPWYPTLRIFRQNTPDKWEDVIAEIVFELKKQEFSLWQNH